MFFSRTPDAQPPGQIPAMGAVPSLVDTSVIIDGRIVDIAKAGFAPGKLLVPRFVLAELQLIADSGDSMKRSKGRRGLELLHEMRQSGVDLEIIEYDYDDIKTVDAKLVRLGRHLNVNVLTTDYNLNRVASIEGVRVLNINELANAVRPVILPGEHMHTKIVQPGKEKSQGVGYLADGTMIVVDSADRLMGQDVEVEITRVFQTVAGKMLFAILVGNPQPSTTRQPSAARPERKDRGPRQDRQDRPERPQGDRQQAKKPNRRSPQPQDRAQQPRSERAQPKPAAAQSSDQKQAQPQRRPRRVSPTQRLENSLMELTGGEAAPDSQSTEQ